MALEVAIDITGDTSGADRGAAALRAEAAAARTATAEVAKLKRAEQELGEERGKAGASVPRRDDPRPAGAAFSTNHEDNFKASPWAQEAAGAKNAEEATRGWRAEQERGGEAAGKAGSKASASMKVATGAAKEAAVTVKDLAKGAIVAGAALAGLRGLGDLTSMAIGWRTLGRLQMVSWKATMDLRQAVRTVDAQPLVRAATALERNLSKSSVTGNALSGILTRGFDATFSAIERLEPVAEAVFQGMVLGALEVEIGYQKVRGTLAPVTVLLEEASDDTDLLTAAAKGTAEAFGAVRDVVESIAKGVRDVADVLGRKGVFGHREADRANDRYNQEQTEERGADASRRAGKNQVFEREEGAGGAWQRNQGEEIAAQQEALGRANGKALADGHVAGMEAGIPAVEAAGRALGEAGVRGARDGADAHSPSRKTKQLGDDMAEGDIQGMRARAGDVERTAAQVLAPDVKPGGDGASASPVGAPVTVHLAVAFHGIDGGKRADLERGADLLVSALRSTLIRAAVPIPGVTR